MHGSASGSLAPTAFAHGLLGRGGVWLARGARGSVREGGPRVWSNPTPQYLLAHSSPRPERALSAVEPEVFVVRAAVVGQGLSLISLLAEGLLPRSELASARD